MKVLNHLLTVVLLLLFCSTAQAQNVNVDDYDNIIYIKDATAHPGETVTLSVILKNKPQVPGYQFDMFLPEGLDVEKDEDNFYRIELSLKRTTAKNTDYFNSAKRKDGAIRVLCASTRAVPFSDNDGEVCTIQLKVGDNVAPDTYPITLKEVVISDVDANAIYPPEVISYVTVSNDAPTYDQGYSVAFTPFMLDGNENGVSADINFNVGSEAASYIKTVDFDLQFPSEWYQKAMISDVVKNASLSTRFYTLSDPTDNEDGTYHFTLTAKTAKYYFGATAHETTKIGSFTLYKDGGGDDGSYFIADGIHQLNIKNVVATDADGNTYKVAPYIGDVYVGEAKATAQNGKVDFNGDYTDESALQLLNSSLQKSTDVITSIDLSNVSAMASNATIATPNPNALIYVPQNISLANEQNVVADNHCSKLVLADGYDFNAPKSFTADEASYQRNVAYNWGTICMPYVVESNGNVQYYTLSEVNEQSQQMLFKAVDKVEAGAPAVFCTSDGASGTLQVNASNVEINTMAQNANTDALNWLMKGTYTSENVKADASSNIYYIADNLFWHANKTFKVAPFRGWFENSSVLSMPAKMFSICVDNQVTNIDAVNTTTNDKVLIYDLSGRQIKSAVGGQINIINGKKCIIK